MNEPQNTGQVHAAQHLTRAHSERMADAVRLNISQQVLHRITNRVYPSEASPYVMPQPDAPHLLDRLRATCRTRGHSIHNDDHRWRGNSAV